MSGIFRDVYLLYRAPSHLRDYFVHTPLSADYRSADIEVELSFSGEALPVKAALFSPDGQKLCCTEAAAGGGKALLACRCAGALECRGPAALYAAAGGGRRGGG